MEQGTRNKEQGIPDLAPGPGGQMRGFRQLIAWQKADQMASAVYRLARTIPARDRWLAVQVLRSAVSVPANIVEGYGRSALRDYIRFLEIANGSLVETEYYLHFLKSNEILREADVQPVEAALHESGAVLAGLTKALRAKLGREGTWQRGLVREEQEDYAVWGED